MIPSFLRSLATLIRRLLSENRCLYLTEADAVELEMLAGLPWAGCHWQVRNPEDPAEGLARELRLVSPADIAWAWLRCSLAPTIAGHPEDGPIVDPGDAKRAAVCAELAVLAARLMPEVRVVEPAMPEDRRQECLKSLRSAGVPEIKPVQCEIVGIDPHEGTSEGARAAWAFILPALQHHAADQSDYAECQRILELARRYERELDALPHPSDKYRRELEAMR